MAVFFSLRGFVEVYFTLISFSAVIKETNLKKKSKNCNTLHEAFVRVIKQKRKKKKKQDFGESMINVRGRYLKFFFIKVHIILKISRYLDEIKYRIKTSRIK